MTFEGGKENPGTGRKTVLRRLTTIIVLVLGILAVVPVFAWWGQAVLYPPEIDWMEPVILMQGSSVAAGENIFAVREGRFVASVYGPLFYQLAGLAAGLTPYSYAGLRAFSLLALFIMLACALWIGRQAGGSWLAGCLAMLLVPLSVSLAKFGPTAKPDAVGLALTAIGLALAQRPDSKRLLGAAALAFAASLFIKQSFLAAPLAVAVTLSGRSRLVFAGVLVASVAAGLGLAFAFYGQDFFVHQIQYNRVGYDWERALFVEIPRYVEPNWPHLVLGIAGVVLTRSRLLGAYLAMTFVGLLIMGKAGANVNHWHESNFAAALAGGPFLAYCLRWPAKRELEATVGLLLFCAMTTVKPSWVPASEDLSLSVENDRNAQAAIRRLLRPDSRSTLVFAAVPGAVARIPGVQLPIADAFTYKEMLASGALPGRLFFDAVRDRQFSYILLNHSETIRFRMSPRQLDAIRENYVPYVDLPGTLFSEGGIRVWRPMAPAP